MLHWRDVNNLPLPQRERDVTLAWAWRYRYRYRYRYYDRYIYCDSNLFKSQITLNPCFLAHASERVQWARFESGPCQLRLWPVPVWIWQQKFGFSLWVLVRILSSWPQNLEKKFKFFANWSFLYLWILQYECYVTAITFIKFLKSAFF